MRRLTPFKIGDKGNIFGLDLTVAGYISYAQWDDGDLYVWENIHLLDKSFKSFWLDYDKYSNQYTFYTEVSFDKILFRSSNYTQIKTADNEEIIVVERGVGQVKGLEGDIPEEIKKQKEVHFIDGESGKQKYSLEYSKDFSNLYSGQNILEHNVLNAFGYKDLAKKQYKKMISSIRWNKIDKFFLLAVISFILGLLVSFIGNQTILEQTVEICVEGRDLCTNETVIGPFETHLFPRIYTIEVNGKLNNVTVPKTETWKSITVEILNDKEEVRNGFNFDLYNEYWVEGGESGKELRDNHSENIRFDNPGKYYLALYAETSSDNRSGSETIDVRVKSRTTYEWLFVINGGVMLVLYAIFRNSKKR